MKTVTFDETQWKLVPVEPTETMIEAGCRALHSAQGTGDADAPLLSSYQNSWDEPDSVRWRQWRHTIVGDEDDVGIYPAALAAAPEPPATRSEADGIEAARPIDEWHEDYGNVVWWSTDPETGDWRGEPAFIGTPLGSDWPDPEYHTHWTPHPAFPPKPDVRALKEDGA
jgi:hypothetical protein